MTMDYDKLDNFKKEKVQQRDEISRDCVFLCEYLELLALRNNDALPNDCITVPIEISDDAIKATFLELEIVKKEPHIVLQSVTGEKYCFL